MSGGGKRKRGTNDGNTYRGGSNAGSPTTERGPFQFQQDNNGGDGRRRSGANNNSFNNHNQNNGGNRGGRGGQQNRGHNSRSNSFSQNRPTSSHSNYGLHNQHQAPPFQSQPQSQNSSRPSTPRESMPPPTPTTMSTPAPVSRPAARPQPPRLDSKAGEHKIWDYITVARLDTWTTGGRDGIIADAAQLSGNKDAIIDLTILLQEIIQAGMDGRIGKHDSSSLLIDLITASNAALSFPDVAGRVSVVDILVDAIALYEKDNSLEPGIVAILNPLLPNHLPQETLRLAFGLEILGAVDPPLVTNPRFKRRINQVSTKLLYRTTKYNLLREETEGYSKLITELHTAGFSPAPLEIVEQTMNNIKSMIGYFDLDPNRVLDILLDVFANSIVQNYRFFVQLLKESPWWPVDVPKKFEESEEERRVRDAKLFDRIAKDGIGAILTDDNGDEVLAKKPGNKTAAQILGFKFRFYTELDTDPEKYPIPETLTALAACLIKIGFISLADLYPHLSPDDEMVKEEWSTWQDNLTAKSRGGKMNALAMSGPLVDDTLPQPPRNGPAVAPGTDIKAPLGEKKEEKPKPEVPRANQKLMLMKNLLAFGCLPESLFFLSKFPNLAYSHPELADHIHRLVHVAIEPLCYPGRPLGDRSIGLRKVVSKEPALVALCKPGHQPLISPPATKTSKALSPFHKSNDPGDTREYKLFWDEWADELPICRNEIDMRVLYLPIIKAFCGTKFAKDPKLLGKIARLGTTAVTTVGATSDTGKAWFNWIVLLLLPAVSVGGPNSGVVNEVFNMMKLYTIEARFSMYGHWHGKVLRMYPEVKHAINAATKDTKDAMKRVSTSNVKQTARAMAKISYSNPVTVFNVVLSQVESYDNLIECVVDSARYFSNMGMDAFSYAILVKLSEERGKVQKDGMLVSKWLSALAQFCGRLYKRYSHLDPSPILQYIGKQMKLTNADEGNAAVLVVLQEMIQSMAGIVLDNNMTEHQITTMSCSEYMRLRTLHSFGDRREESKSTAKRLTRALLSTGMAGQLIVILAQERQMCLYRPSDAPIKVLGNRFDSVSLVQGMYTDMLKFCLDKEQWEAAIPDVNSLIVDYGIEHGIAWTLTRHLWADQIRKEQDEWTEEEKRLDAEDKAAAKEAKKEVKEEIEGEVVMGGIEAETPAVKVDSEDAPTATEDVAMSDTVEDAPEEEIKHKQPTFLPTLQMLADKLRPCLTDSISPEGDLWSKFSLPFYVTFWTSSMYDASGPMKTYDEERSAITSEINRINKDNTISSHTRKLRTDRLRDASNKMHSDLKTHLTSTMAFGKRLMREKTEWFTGPECKATQLVKYIWQYCIHPRVTLSPADALYCACFIRRIHMQGTPNFWTIRMYDTIFDQKNLHATIWMCTEREIENFARFLAEVLTNFEEWHRDRKKYEHNAHGTGKKTALPGFAKTWTTNPDEEPVLMNYEDFRRVLYKWHKQLHQALKMCLGSAEYMHIRNATVVLKYVAKVFPVVDWHGKGIVEKVTKLSDEETRHDLKVASTALLGMLKKREKDWIPVQAFQHSVADAGRSPNMQSSKSSTPAPSDPNLKTQVTLNPEALPFNASKPPTITVHHKGGKDVEDGEIDDAAGARRAQAGYDTSSVSNLQPLQRNSPAMSSKDLPRRPSPGPGNRDSRSVTPNGRDRDRDRDSRQNQNGPPRSQPDPYPRGQQNYLERDNRGRSSTNERLPLPDQNSARPQHTSPRELMPERPPHERDQRGWDGRDYQQGQQRDDRRGRSGDQLPRDPPRHNVPLPQPPASLPPRPNAPIPNNLPRPVPGRMESETRTPGRNDRHRRDSPPRRHGDIPPNQLPDLMEVIGAKTGNANDRGGRGGAGERRPQADHRSRSPQRVDIRSDGRPESRDFRNDGRPPAGPRADVDNHRDRHRDSDRERDSRGGRNNLPQNLPPIQTQPSKDLFTPTHRAPSGPANLDPNHGRLNSQVQNENHGRLNQPPSQSAALALETSNSIPSGPRSTRQGSRSFASGVNLAVNNNQQQQQQSPQSRGAGTSVNSAPLGVRGSVSSQSQPPTPTTTQTDVSALPMHPDRAKAFGVEPGPPAAAPIAPALVGIHPTRLYALQSETGTAAPPAGPRSPIASKLSPVGAPSGPAGGRGERGGAATGQWPGRLVNDLKQHANPSGTGSNSQPSTPTDAPRERERDRDRERDHREREREREPRGRNRGGRRESNVPQVPDLISSVNSPIAPAEGMVDTQPSSGSSRRSGHRDGGSGRDHHRDDRRDRDRERENSKKSSSNSASGGSGVVQERGRERERHRDERLGGGGGGNQEWERGRGSAGRNTGGGGSVKREHRGGEDRPREELKRGRHG